MLIDRRTLGLDDGAGDVTTYPDEPTVDGPRLKGRACVHKDLDAPEVTRPKGGKVRYEWRRDGIVVPDEAGDDYGLTAADLGARISVRVTVVDRDGAVVDEVVSRPSEPVRWNAWLSEDAESAGGGRVELSARVRYRKDKSDKKYRAPGVVTVYEGGEEVAVLELGKGKAFATITDVPAGRHRYTFVYEGPADVRSRTETDSVTVS